jgi:hypothetical protein
MLTQLNTCVMRLLYELRLHRPRRVNIELTNACNFDCSMCLRNRMTRDQQVMTDAVFERALSLCTAGYVRNIEFAAWGESTLDPAVYDRIARAVDQGFACSITTNGSHLDVDRLLATGIQRVIFSLHASNPEEYASYTKARFSLEELEARILELKTHPRMLSGDLHTRVGVNHYTGGKVDLNDLPDGVFLADEVRVAPIFDFSTDVRKEMCDVLLSSLVIYADGTIGLGCCWDVNADFAIGHVMQDSLRSALYSTRAREHIRETRHSDMCRKCYDSRYLKKYRRQNVTPRRAGSH